MKKNVYMSKAKPVKMDAEIMALPGAPEFFAHSQAMADEINALEKQLRVSNKELARLKKRPTKIAPKYR